MGKTFTNKSSNKSSRKEEPNFSDFSVNDELIKIIKDCDLLLLAYILKTTTNKDKTMIASEICDQLNFLIPSNDLQDSNDFFNERTIRRRIELFSILESSQIEIIENIRKLLPFIIGGQIVSTSTDVKISSTKTRPGKQKHYFFDPILSDSDMDLIWGSIASNIFLSAAEKDYLLKRLHVLLPDYGQNQLSGNLYRDIREIDELPKLPKKTKDSLLPMDSSRLLSNIRIIHEAIEQQLQIEVVYGIYDIAEKSSKVTFHERNQGEPYILNPYAMMWNDGHFYLIANHDNYPNISHFRLDRIISVKVHTEHDKHGVFPTFKRKKIPDSLVPFFKRKKGYKAYFDGVAYANAHPNMKIYHDVKNINVTFECTASSLQILIDYFGPDITLSPSPISHSKDELDYNGKEQAFFAATIRNVQYENAYRFAIAQSEYLTLLQPADLVNAVAKQMQTIAERYEKYSSL